MRIINLYYKTDNDKYNPTEVIKQFEKVYKDDSFEKDKLYNFIHCFFSIYYRHIDYEMNCTKPIKGYVLFSNPYSIIDFYSAIFDNNEFINNYTMNYTDEYIYLGTQPNPYNNNTNLLLCIMMKKAYHNFCNNMNIKNHHYKKFLERIFYYYNYIINFTNMLNNTDIMKIEDRLYNKITFDVYND